MLPVLSCRRNQVRQACPQGCHVVPEGGARVWDAGHGGLHRLRDDGDHCSPLRCREIPRQGQHQHLREEGAASTPAAPGHFDRPRSLFSPSHQARHEPECEPTCCWTAIASLAASGSTARSPPDTPVLSCSSIAAPCLSHTPASPPSCTGASPFAFPRGPLPAASDSLQVIGGVVCLNATWRKGMGKTHMRVLEGLSACMTTCCGSTPACRSSSSHALAPHLSICFHALAPHLSTFRGFPPGGGSHRMSLDVGCQKYTSRDRLSSTSIHSGAPCNVRRQRVAAHSPANDTTTTLTFTSTPTPTPTPTYAPLPLTPALHPHYHLHPPHHPYFHLLPHAHPHLDSHPHSSPPAAPAPSAPTQTCPSLRSRCSSRGCPPCSRSAPQGPRSRCRCPSSAAAAPRRPCPRPSLPGALPP